MTNDSPQTPPSRRRGLRIAIEVLGGLILGLTVLVGVAIYLLSSGPVSVSALTPTIEDALNPEGSPFTVRVEETRIVWGGWDRAVDVIAGNVTVTEPGVQESPIAVLPEVSVALSFRRLLAGEIRLTGLDILRPSITLLRDPDGNLSVAFDDLAADTEQDDDDPRPDRTRIALSRPDDDGLLPKPLLDALTAGLQQTTLLGGLERFSILQAEVQLIDKGLGETLWLHSAALDIVRSPDGLDASLVGTLETPTENALIGGLIKAQPDEDRIDFAVSFASLDTDLPVRYFPDLVFYLPDLTVSGTVGATFNLKGEPVRFEADLDSAAGAVSLSAAVQSSLPALSIDAAFEEFDAAVWLGGVHDVQELLNYFPRVPLTGEASVDLGPDGLLEGLTTDMTADIGTATLALARNPSDGRYALESDFAGLRPAGVAEMAPDLVDLATADVSLDGSIAAVLNADGSPASGQLNMTIGGGSILLPGILESLPPLQEGSLAMRLTPDGGPVLVDELRLDFGGPVIMADASLMLADERAELTANAVVEDMAVARISDFWPAGVASNAQIWMAENMTEGSVHRAEAALQLVLPDLDPDKLEVLDLGGEIRFTGANVHYLRPLAPVTDIDGVARFDASSFNITVETGRLEDATVRGGTVLLTNLGEELEWADISIDVDTSLKTALALLDTEPRRYISRIGLDASGISGMAEATVNFRFPLIASLEGDQINYGAQATLRDVSVPREDLNGIVRAEEAVLTLTTEALNVEGDVTIDEIPARAVWRESFGGASDETRSLSVSTVADLTELRRFDVDLAGFAEGRAGLSANYSVFRSGAQSLAVSADLRDARLTIDTLKWEKPTGAASILALEAVIAPDGAIQVDRVLLDGGEDHRLEGALEAAPGMSDLISARIDALRLNDTDVSGTVQQADGAYHVALSGSRLDLSPILDDDDEPEDTEPEPTDPKVRFQGTFDQLTHGPDRVVRQAEISVFTEGPQIRSLSLTGTIGDGDALEAYYLPREDGSRSLLIRAEDTGLALSVADITGRLEGGILTIEGGRASAEAPLIGSLKIQDFTLREAPRLVKILELVSVTGITSALGNEGLAFQTLTADFEMTGDIVQIKDAAARGSTIGITVEGTIDRASDALNLTGEIAVSDILSKTVGRLPIINWVLGDGLIGAAFTMTGPADDPDVAVNPLSVLAPRFVNRVLGAGVPLDSDEEGASPDDDPKSPFKQDGN